jgi:hypothetical protein
VNRVFRSEAKLGIHSRGLTSKGFYIRTGRRDSRTFSSVGNWRTFWKGRSLVSLDCNISAFLFATFDDLLFMVASRILQLS